MWRNVSFVVIVALIIVGAVAWPTATSFAQGGQAASPSIRIVKPKAGETTKTQGIEVTVAIKNFKLDGRAVGKSPLQGRGHWHLFLDNRDLGPQKKPTAKVKSIPAGEHTVIASLRNNNHSELSPPVSDTVKFVVGVKKK